MGIIEDKCGCFKNNSKVIEYNLDDENKAKSTTVVEYSPNHRNEHKNESKLQNLLNSLGSSNNRKFNLMIKNNENEEKINLDLNEFICSKENLRKLVKLQAFFKGFKLRKYFHSSLRNMLYKETISLIEYYTNKFRTDLLIKVEENIIQTFDPTGWMKFYPLNEKLFNFSFGKVDNSTVFLDEKKESIYSGEMNLKTKKHGYGVYLTKNGIKYEGSWINDSFTCWGRMIDNQGNIATGKF